VLAPSRRELRCSRARRTPTGSMPRCP